MLKRVLPLMVAASWGIIAEDSLASTIHQVYYDANRKGIVIKFSGPIQASHRQLDGPDRLVIDISDATMTGGTRRHGIKNGLISEIRVAQYSISPSIVRVVANLKGPIFPALQARKDEVFVALSTKPEPLLKPTFEPEYSPSPKPTPRATPRPSLAVTPKPATKPAIVMAKPSPLPKPIKRNDVVTPVIPSTNATPYSTIPTSPWLPAPTPTPVETPTPAPIMDETPTPPPIPAPSESPVLPTSRCPRSSSLHWVIQQLEINESYPTINGDSSTYGVLSDVRGLLWRHWINDYVGLNLEGRYATFNLVDRRTSLPSQRQDTVAQTGLTARLPLGAFQPELQLGFRLRQVIVKTNPEIADTESYPALGNMSIMGPIAGLGLRVQIFEPLTLTMSGQFTPMTVSSAGYNKLIAITPLGETRATAGLLLDLNPIQLSLGANMESILGSSYSQTNSGIMLGVGFGY